MERNAKALQARNFGNIGLNNEYDRRSIVCSESCANLKNLSTWPKKVLKKVEGRRGVSVCGHLGAKML